MKFFGTKIKKFVIYSLLTAIVFSAFPANTVNAQDNGSTGGNPASYWTNIKSEGACNTAGGTWMRGNSLNNYTNFCAPPGVQTTGYAEVKSTPFCELWVVGGICNIVFSLMMVPSGIASFFVFLAGKLLDFVLDFTVVNMYQRVKDISGINVAWGVIRDLVNLSFIFILLYAAIKTILGDSGLIKRTIVGVVIAAILVNFSLFFAKVIIDASNLTALTIHNAIVQSCDNTGGSIKSLSSCFMQPMGLSTIYSPKNNEALLDGIGNSFLTAAVVATGSLVFTLLTAFVFLAITVMFLMRFVVIVLLFVLSPIAVMGTLMPQLQSQTKKWWSSITDQAIFAPAFMLMAWVTLSILYSSGLAFDGSSIADSFKGPDEAVGAIPMIFKFSIAIALLISTLIISKNFSKAGGSMGSALAGKVIGGTTGWAGRQTLGRMGTRIGKSDTLNKLAEKKGVAGIVGRRALRGTSSVAKGGYDFRSTGLGKTLGAGAPSKGGGFTERREQDEKERQQAGERVKMNELKRTINRGVADGALPAEVEEMKRALARASNKEVEEIAAGNKELLNIGAFAESISTRQLEAIEKSDKFNETEKGSLKATRFADAMSITGLAGPVSPAAKDRIRSLTDKEIEMIDPKMLKDDGFVEFLKPSQAEAIMKSDKFTSEQKASLGKLRSKILKDKILGDPTRPTAPNPAVIKDKNVSVKQLADLDVGTLTNPGVLDNLSISMLKKIGSEIDASKAAAFRSAVSAMPAPAGSHLDEIQDWLNSDPGREAF